MYPLYRTLALTVSLFSIVILMFIKRPVIAGVGPGSQWGTAERKPRRQVTTIETRAEKERKKRKDRERERERKRERDSGLLDI